MKRVLLFFILLIVVSMSVPVSSLSAEALVKVPGDVTVDGISLKFDDLSLDGRLLVDVYLDGSHYESMTLLPGENASVGDLKFEYKGAYIGSESLVMIGLQYPYLLSGGELTLGDYRFKVLSVDQKGFKINATYRGESKVFTSPSFKIGHLSVKVNSTPKVFEGVLNPGENVTVDGHYVKLVKIWASNSSGKIVSGAVFEVDGKSYSVESGKSQVIQPFVVNLKSATIVGELGEKECDNCKGYADVSISLLAVSVDIETVPDAKIKLSPGQTASVGPYILRYDYPLGSAVRVSLLNSCGQKLAGGRLTSGKVSYVLTYPGLIVGLDDISGESATFFVFLDPSEFPDVTKTANLLMSLEVGNAGSVKQYVPFDVVLRAKNTGSVPLKNVVITFEPSNGLELLSKGTVSIDSIAPGNEVVLRFRVLPIQSGTIELGRAYATVLAPFELACSHCTILTFTSNTGNVTVEPSTIGYNVSVAGPKSVPVGVPFNVSVTVRNIGDVSVPANLSLRVPSGVGIELSKGMALKNGVVVVPIDLAPGDEGKFTFELVPASPGNYSFTAVVKTPYGEYSPVEFSVEAVPSTAVITKTVCVNGTGSSAKTSPENGVTVTTTITSVTTVTKYETKTVTSTVEVPYTPLTSKLLWFGIGVAIGVGAIIAVAWYMARSS